MYGVVSLLDDPHYRLVEEIWSELEANFGARGIYLTPFPHFSYQVAVGYDAAGVEEVMRQFAAERTPLTVTATGLGIFTGPEPVLYIPVVRTSELSRLQRALWPELCALGRGVVDTYSPECWMPHVTLALGDLNRENLGEIVRHLSGRALQWQLSIDNLALIGNDPGERCALHHRVAFH